VCRQSAARANALRHRFAVDEAHDEEDVSAQLVRTMDGDDVLVRERRDGSRLAYEAFAYDRIAGEMRRERLDGDEAIESHVARPIHDAHTAATDLMLDRVLSGERSRELHELG
jgi:hypothetical protein